MESQKLGRTLLLGIFALFLVAGFADARKMSTMTGSKTFLLPYECSPWHKFFLWKKPCTPVPTVPTYKPPTPEYQQPTPVYKPTPNPVYNPTPSRGYNPTPSTGYNPTPSTGYNPTPSTGYNPTPTPTEGYGPKFTFPPIYKHPFFKKKPFCPPAKDEKKN